MRGTGRNWTNAGRLFHHEQLVFSVHYWNFVELCIVIGAAAVPGQDVAYRNSLDLVGFDREAIRLYFCDALYPYSHRGRHVVCMCFCAEEPWTYVVRPWGFSRMHVWKRWLFLWCGRTHICAKEKVEKVLLPHKKRLGM
jgi:hypothetical protein